MKGAARNRLKKYQAMKQIVRNRVACEDCGATTGLTFHHLDPTAKSFTIGNVSHERYFVGAERLQAEIEKCDVLCERCHQKREKEAKTSAGLAQW